MRTTLHLLTKNVHKNEIDLVENNYSNICFELNKSNQKNEQHVRTI